MTATHIAANDNHTPHHADQFETLADRRAWLVSLPDKAKPVLAWPTAERLARLDSPAAAQALYRYAELMAPAHMVPANDNFEPVGDPDMIQETRPSVGELMRALEDVRCHVVSERINGQWQIKKRHERTSIWTETGRGGAVCFLQIGELIFRNGELVSYGSTSKGNKTKRPAERTRQPKGAKPSPRSESSIRKLLPANDNTPIAAGSGWLGGVTRARGNCTRPDIGDHAAAEEMARNAKRAAVRLALGLDAAVLDAAITDASAREIGEAFGHSGKAAERAGIAKINAAIEKLQKIAA